MLIQSSNRCRGDGEWQSRGPARRLFRTFENGSDRHQRPYSYRTYERIVSVVIGSVLGMSVGVASAPVMASPVDPLCVRLDGMLAELAQAVAGCADLRDVGEVSDAARIERIARLEQLKAAAAGLQAAESVRFAQSQVAQQIAAEVHPRVVGRGIADQLALACQVSPVEGSRRLGVARALWFDLPATFRLLTRGRISEYVASLVVSETRHLDAQTRRRVDTTIVAAGID